MGKKILILFCYSKKLSAFCPSQQTGLTLVFCSPRHLIQHVRRYTWYMNTSHWCSDLCSVKTWQEPTVEMPCIFVTRFICNSPQRISNTFLTASLLFLIAEINFVYNFHAPCKRFVVCLFVCFYRAHVMSCVYKHGTVDNSCLILI
jgi:hypothetical protein